MLARTAKIRQRFFVRDLGVGYRVFADCSSLFQKVQANTKEHPGVRLMGSWGLFSLGHTPQGVSLGDALQSEDDDVRIIAAKAITEYLRLKPDYSPAGIRRLLPLWKKRTARLKT